jgi:hypothetical protein
MARTKKSESESWSKIQKTSLSTDYSLELENMKVESLVIAKQHVAVNMFRGLVHTARHAMEIKTITSKCTLYVVNIFIEREVSGK